MEMDEKQTKTDKKRKAHRNLFREKWGESHRRNGIIPVISAVLTCMQLCGYQISMRYHTSVHTALFWQKLGELTKVQGIIVGIVEFFLWNGLLSGLFCFMERRSERAAGGWKAKPGLWLLVALLLFLCWIPALLGCYPGFYNYDIRGQLPQVLYPDSPYVAHHPLLHTLTAGGVITFGYHISGDNLTIGVLAHSVFQMLVCAMGFGYALYFIVRQTRKKWLAAGAFVYYAFFPVIVMFTMSTTKDVICSVLLLVSVLLLYEFCREPEKFLASKGKRFGFLAALVLSCLFRNNIIYALVLLFPCMLLLLRRYAGKVFLLFGGAIAAYFILSHALLWGLQAVPGGKAEAFSVPFQQVARVYAEQGEEAFSEKDRELLYACISRDSLEGYNPFLADYIKNFVNFDEIAAHAGTYLQMWVRLGMRYPKIYLKSFLENTYQAWYPWTSVIDDPASSHIYYFDFDGYPPIEKTPYIKGIYRFYEKISKEFYYQRWPVLRILFSMGGMMWAALLAWAYGIWRKDRAAAAAVTFVLLVCVTVFLGPVSLVRYYLILFYMFPAYPAFVLGRTERESV